MPRHSLCENKCDRTRCVEEGWKDFSTNHLVALTKAKEYCTTLIKLALIFGLPKLNQGLLKLNVLIQGKIQGNEIWLFS